MFYWVRPPDYYALYCHSIRSSPMSPKEEFFLLYGVYKHFTYLVRLIYGLLGNLGLKILSCYTSLIN